MLSEKDIISKFLRPLAINREAQNLNNDGAILKQSNSNFVISSDMMIENIHFYENDDPKLLGRKLLRVNLSDLAAMGCKPYGYILNLGIPKLKTDSWLKKFCSGLKLDQEKFGLKLFGGDLSKSEIVFLSITIIGVKGKSILECSKAKNYSDIFVSGNIGDAGLGLFLKQNPDFIVDKKLKNFFLNKLHTPKPRLGLSQNLCGYADACTDISDGLILDLKKISSLSNLQSNIFLNQIPLSIQAKKMKKIINDDNYFWEKILTGGEDYELIFSMSKSKQNTFIENKKNNLIYLKKIGYFKNGSGIKIHSYNNFRLNLKKIGYSHF